MRGKWLWSRDDDTNKNTESTKNDEGIDSLWVVLGLALGTIITIGIGFNWLVSLTIGVLTLAAVAVGASIPIAALIRRRKYREDIKSIEKERDSIRREREDAKGNDTVSLKLTVPEGESPVSLLRTAIMNGNASAASLARAYAQLEDMMTKDGLPLDVARSKYSPRFSGLAQLLELRDDVRAKPRMYGISTAQMDAMISDAVAALADDMASDARTITNKRVISARATADYIVSADVDRKPGVDHLTALTDPSTAHPAPVSTSGNNTADTHLSTGLASPAY